MSLSINNIFYVIYGNLKFNDPTFYSNGNISMKVIDNLKKL